MADPRGPKLALGDTEAGKDVADSVEKAEKLAQTKQELAKVQQAQEVLAQKYDESLFEEFKQKRKELRRKDQSAAVGLCAPRSWAERLWPPSSRLDRELPPLRWSLRTRRL